MKRIAASCGCWYLALNVSHFEKLYTHEMRMSAFHTHNKNEYSAQQCASLVYATKSSAQNHKHLNRIQR